MNVRFQAITSRSSEWREISRQNTTHVHMYNNQVADYFAPKVLRCTCVRTASSRVNKIQQISIASHVAVL